MNSSQYLFAAVVLATAASACSKASGPAHGSPADANASAADVSLADAPTDDTGAAPDVDAFPDSAPDSGGDLAAPTALADSVVDIFVADFKAPAETAADTPPDTQPDTPADIAAQPDAAVDALPLPTTATATASCKDKRQRKDEKMTWDECWAPPQHYCAGPDGAMAWFGCSPDQKACFHFDIFCHPCGWTKCPIVSKWDPPPTKLPPGCPTYMVYQNPQMTVPPEVQPYMPNNTIFCWDGAPPEWKTKKFHALDGKL